jgi:Zn-dependent membrane protease YugP
MWAQFKVKGTFSEMSRVATRRGLTGAEAARRILDAQGLSHVPVEPVAGQLTDHYDPQKRVLRLSESVYASRSAAAVGVAAHEAGHAVQHAVGYAPLALRSFMVPSVRVGGWVGPLLLMVGILFQSQSLLLLGIVFFAAVTLFSVVTLPVEFDASSRALRLLPASGIVGDDELPAVKRVLNAAAMTYVAAAIQSIMTLLYYLWRSGILGGRR